MAEDEIPRQNPALIDAPAEQIAALLENGEVDLIGVLPWSSNYTLLVRVADDTNDCLAVYKPRRGERPLWDFPRGTLCQRERAAYLVSAALGWNLVPPTVLRDGPYGVGSLQFFIEADFNVHLLMMEKQECYREAILRLVAFDLITNNADRKSGHCLQGSDGRLWAIDHGITFHTDYKLRTVLWDYIGDPIPPDDLEDLRRLQGEVRSGAGSIAELRRLINGDEMKAFQRRLDRLVARGVFPTPGGGPNIPWPPV